jgi:alkaline phosphatase
MKRLICSILGFVVVAMSHAQVYTSSSVFSHNDYVHAVPFYTSYALQVGYIEADVFLHNNNLLVAHTLEEINNRKTLDSLYLKPIENQLVKNKGSSYSDGSKMLTLMIDLKTDGIATLNLLVKKLNNYQQLLSTATFRVTVSGNVPDPELWKNYPGFIHFDGRPGIHYTEDQLLRIALISADFRDYAEWNGVGLPTKLDEMRIRSVVDDVHAQGKVIRFWAAPDSENAWSVLRQLNVDLINTDNVEGALRFIATERE